jgi:hypothetical protein
MMGEEDRVENLDQEGYRSLLEMLQSPVRDTVRARSLADPETHDGLRKVCSPNFKPSTISVL